MSKKLHFKAFILFLHIVFVFCIHTLNTVTAPLLYYVNKTGKNINLLL